MTRKEFVGHLRAAQREGLKVVACLTLALLALCGGSLWLLVANLMPYLQFAVDHSWAQFAAFFGMIILMAGVTIPFVFWLRAIQRRHHLRCPHCKRGYVALSAQMVIAGGHCCFCGEALFDEERPG